MFESKNRTTKFNYDYLKSSIYKLELCIAPRLIWTEIGVSTI